MQHQFVPCMLMRGGTSKGPFFLASDLPEQTDERDALLLSAMGSPDVRQIDGLGGADTLTSKVAMVSPSTRDGVDVDYLFAQVKLDEAIVDTGPNCGNMLAGVGPFALERGLVDAKDGETTVVIYNVNTGTRVEAVVQTPGGRVNYSGATAIDGVPGTSAPVLLNFFDVVGSKCGAMFPTGNPFDLIDGVAVSCVDVGMPMIHMAAEAFGLSGYEDRNTLAALDRELMQRLEAIRCEAGARMGFADVRDSVMPKIGLLAPPRHGGTITSRYFTPWAPHAAHAVTGGICIAAAATVTGTIAHDMSDGVPADGQAQDVVIEHPSGTFLVKLTAQTEGDGQVAIEKAGILRTARLIMRGDVLVAAA